MKYLSFLTLLILFPALALAATTTDTSFVPLTNIPALFETGNQFNLQDFLNGLYRICIGAAAVIAVLQIMRAGIMYMGGDSVTEKKEARNLIGLAIGGLILVLSPVIVFSIINPEILSLQIGGIDKLQTADDMGGSNVCTPACTGGNRCMSGQCVPPNDGDGTCKADCVAGRVCKAGACVAVSAESCTSTIANGAPVKTIAQQNCCAIQTGCKVTIGTGGAFADPVCSCSPTGAIEYGWRYTALYNDNGSLKTGTFKKGPFTSNESCVASLTAFKKEYDPKTGDNYTRECDCGRPLSDQQGCSPF